MKFSPIINPIAKILLIGEAPAPDDRTSLFSGASGQELDFLLRDAELSRMHVSLTALFKEKIPGGDINNWAVPRKDLKKLTNPNLPFNVIPCKKGAVDPGILQPALKELIDEIHKAKPNVIGVMGNSPLAALCGISGIGKLRGALHFFETIKIIPTYHPGFVLRNYESRPAVVADFQKLKIESESKEANLLNRKIYLDPTKEDLKDWVEYLSKAQHLACDIETKARQITCMGFAPNKKEAFVIPLWTPKGNYWDEEGEILAYKAIKAICESSAIKIFQNGLYDVQYLIKYKIKVKNFSEDTMLLHHSLYPALPKSLDFLGSIYCSERAWKRWRSRGDEEFKPEE